MKTRIICDADELFESLRELFSWADVVDMSYAWANSAGGMGRHWKAMPLTKVRRAVVGTAFAQTEPAALSALAESSDRLRLVINSGGTFHPKAIIGYRGEQARAIVGSANFTRAAYTSNTELSVKFSGQKNSPQMQGISEFIEQQWNSGAKLDPVWLAKYALVWEREKKRAPIIPQAPFEITSITSLDMSWDRYVEVINAQEGRTFSDGFRIQIRGEKPSYFWELAQARAIFERGVPFASLSKTDRDILMGRGETSGLLGTMGAAGYASEISDRTPEKIGEALDQLPLEGSVSVTKVRALLELLWAHKGISVGVASRLFSVKRPDLFVSVNNGSKPQLANLRNGRQITRLEHYMELLETVWDTEWHRSTPPRDALEAGLWDRRAALLDAALYQQVGRPAVEV